jgi:hypothetical protein
MQVVVEVNVDQWLSMWPEADYRIFRGMVSLESGEVSAKYGGVLLTDFLYARSTARNIAVLLEVDHNLRANRFETLRKFRLSLSCRMLLRCQGKNVVPSSEENCQHYSHPLYRSSSHLLIDKYYRNQREDSYEVMSSPDLI